MTLLFQLATKNLKTTGSELIIRKRRKRHAIQEKYPKATIDSQQQNIFGVKKKEEMRKCAEG